MDIKRSVGQEDSMMSKLSLEIQPGISVIRMCRDNPFRISDSSVLNWLETGSEMEAQVWPYMLFPKEHACFYLSPTYHYFPFVYKIEAVVSLVHFFPMSKTSCMVLVLGGPALDPIIFLALFRGNLNFTLRTGQDLLCFLSFPLSSSPPPPSLPPF